MLLRSHRIESEARPVLDEFCSELAGRGFVEVDLAAGLRRAARDRGPERYGRHPSYYRVACRDRLRAFRGDGDSLLVLTDARTASCLRSGPGSITIVRPILGDAPVDVVSNLAEACAAAGVPAVLKGITSELAEELRAAGAPVRGYLPDECWAANARMDDETFPEVLLRCEARARDSKRSWKGLTFSEASAQGIEAEVRQLYARWRTWFLARNPGLLPDPIDSYFEVMLSREVIESLDVVVRIDHGSQLAAIGGGNRIDSERVDMWLGLAAPRPYAVSKLLYRVFADACLEKGYGVVGLGGSEDLGLHRFKLRAMGYATQQQEHLVVDPP